VSDAPSSPELLNNSFDSRSKKNPVLLSDNLLALIQLPRISEL